MRKSEQVRHLIVRDREAGKTYQQIADTYEISIGGARKIYQKYKEKGTYKTLYGGGRKPKISKHQQMLIKRKINTNPCTSAKELKECLQLDASVWTVRRKLKAMGLNNFTAKKRPMISKRNRSKRMAFAKRYVNMPQSYWDRIIWSDESKFELKNSKKRKRVWCHQSDRLKPNFIQPTVKHGGGSFMIWGCFSSSGVGNLVKIDGRMTGQSYVQILTNNLEESAQKMSLESFIFQQDNDPKHTSRIATAYFNENSIERLEWPPQSPDLNPIEHLWSILDSRIEVEQRKNLPIFWEQLQNAWNNIPNDMLTNLTLSMKKRLEAVIANKGGNTKY